MEIKFDTTIDDLVESHFRLLTRRKTYQKNRWFGVVGAFWGVGAVFFILKFFSNAELPLWLPLLLGGIGATVYLIFYPDITKKNIKKYLAERLKDELPCPTTYTIKDGYIMRNLLNKDTSFAVSDLVQFAEDEKIIELYFGPKSLWVIPKRAFESTQDMDEFKNIIKGA